MTKIEPWMAEIICDELNVKSLQTDEETFEFDTIERKLIDGKSD